uniref:Secreted protein n=1 Tax=Knipowitschia caucasica TaxID=637954 RepID=A0AAV2KUX2_KNICA
MTAAVVRGGWPGSVVVPCLGSAISEPRSEPRSFSSSICLCLSVKRRAPLRLHRRSIVVKSFVGVNGCHIVSCRAPESTAAERAIFTGSQRICSFHRKRCHGLKGVGTGHSSLTGGGSHPAAALLLDTRVHSESGVGNTNTTFWRELKNRHGEKSAGVWSSLSLGGSVGSVRLMHE